MWTNLPYVAFLYMCRCMINCALVHYGYLCIAKNQGYPIPFGYGPGPVGTNTAVTPFQVTQAHEVLLNISYMFYMPPKS